MLKGRTCNFWQALAETIVPKNWECTNDFSNPCEKSAQRMVFRMLFPLLLLLSTGFLELAEKTLQNRKVSSADGEQTKEPSGL